MREITFNFTGKNALVTGGARGIGLEIARAFLEAGATVAIWDFSETAIAEAMRDLQAFGSHVHFQTVNVADATACNDAARLLPFQIEILVNNAGITRDKTFAKLTNEDIDSVLDTNLRGVFNVTKAFIEKFRPDSNSKRIVNIASVVALYGNFGQTNYAAAKAGVIGFTKSLARELGRKGFSVNAIAPGFTLTPMAEAMPLEARKAIESRIPLGRLASPREIANSCLFLASGEAAYINGAVLSVDGGLVS